MDIPDGIAIRDLSWEAFQENRVRIRDWDYPRNKIAPAIQGFSPGQRLMINLYGALALLAIPAGLIVPWYLGNWWWAFLLLAAVLFIQVNRFEMERLFRRNLVGNRPFYEWLRGTEMGAEIKARLRAAE